MTGLCLNMIVKNEAAIIERCLNSVADYIDYAVIVDTGSTDGTLEVIRAFFEKRGIAWTFTTKEFEDFATSRNHALQIARDCPVNFDHLLMVDADMEMVVEKEAAIRLLSADAYRLFQHSQGLSYRNVRIIKRHVAAEYIGPTHEYLNVWGETADLDGVWFRDHADGSGRGDKWRRDIALLSEAVMRDPEDARSVFYLAQSYRDAGDLAEAAVWYQKRAAMGGWAEEAWNARLQQARCYLKLGEDLKFIEAAWDAFGMRPTRVEPLYELARYYRIRAKNELAAQIAVLGIATPQSRTDILFLEDYAPIGLREEFSIAAFYCPAFKIRGQAVCQNLAYDKSVPEHTRTLAMNNLAFYESS